MQRLPASNNVLYEGPLTFLFCFDFFREAGFFFVLQNLISGFLVDLEDRRFQDLCGKIDKKMKLDGFVAHRLVPFCREQLMSNIVREW